MVTNDSKLPSTSSLGVKYPRGYEDLQKQLDNSQQTKLAKGIIQYNDWLVAAEAKMRELSGPPSASYNASQVAAGLEKTTSRSIRDPTRDPYGLLIEPAPALDDLKNELKEQLEADLQGELEYVLFGYDEKYKQAYTRLRDIDSKRALREISTAIQDVKDEGEQDTARHDQGTNIPDKSIKSKEYRSTRQQPATSTMNDVHTPDESTTDSNEETMRGSTSAPRYPRLGINPTLITIRVNMSLKYAADILGVRKQSVNKIDAARGNVDRAKEVAKESRNEPLLARCEFYYGMISFRRGSVRSAVQHFRDSTDANWDNSTYPERNWARQWVTECERIIETRGVVSRNSTPTASPTDSLATEDGHRRSRPGIKGRNRQQSGGSKSLLAYIFKKE